MGELETRLVMIGDRLWYRRRRINGEQHGIAVSHCFPTAGRLLCAFCGERPPSASDATLDFPRGDSNLEPPNRVVLEMVYLSGCRTRYQEPTGAT